MPCRRRLTVPLACALTVGGLLVAPPPVRSQVVELNPVPLDGTIRIGDNRIRSLIVTASSTGVGTATVQLAPDAVEAVYSMLVQVPAGSSASYRITISASLSSADGTQSYQFQYQKPASVLVRDGEPATLDLVLDPAPRIEATVTALPGERLERVTLLAQRWESGGIASFVTSLEAPAGGVEALTLGLPVAPDVLLRCFGSASMTNGRSAELEPFQLVTVPDGGVAECSFDVAEPPLLGTLRGAIDFAGELPVDAYEIFVNAVSGGADPPALQLLPPFSGPGNRAEYRFTDLQEGRYDVDARIRLNDGIDELTMELADRVLVGGGDTLVVGADFCQAFIETRFALGGLTAPQDWQLDAQPTTMVHLGEGAATSRRPLDPREGGPFRFVVREGSWRQVLRFGIFRDRFAPGGFANTSTSGTGFRFQQPIVVECGQTATPPERVLETGRVEIRFQVADGRFLQSPLIRASCRHSDEETGQLVYAYETLSHSATPSFSVPVGIVPVEAPAGVCDFAATARVDNVTVSFGSLNDIEIRPGVETVIAFGGPRVEIGSPAPGAVVDAAELRVEGVATDDRQVTSVVVNGVAASLQPSGNPGDPVEVSYTADVPLESGANRITAVATDDDGNVAEASQSVENERAEEPPLPCDIDGDRDVDVDDVGAIFAARGSLATGVDDPRDANGDGLISINDGRLCVLQCSKPGCQP